MRRPNVRVEARRHHLSGSHADRVRSTQQLLRILKRACNEAGVWHEFKEHEYFIRKTDKKRRKKMLRRRGAQLQETEKPREQERD
jgi:ribosomal protein S21